MRDMERQRQAEHRAAESHAKAKETLSSSLEAVRQLELLSIEVQLLKIPDPLRRGDGW